jgi:hypothetical protein
VNLRAGLNDATTNVAGGTPLGALVSGGWGGILPILRRQATLLESLFAVVTTGVGTGVGALGATGNPGLLVLEGAITAQNVADIRGGV